MSVTIRIYPESWAAMNVDRAGAKYRPGNGTDGEIWRPVVGYEGWYEVSSTGRVKRVGRGAKVSTGGILRPSKNTNEYLRVALSAGDGNQKHIYVHKLVAQAFIGPRPDGHEVNHKDSDRTNARYENLEYVTRSGNMRHMILQGRSPTEKQKYNALGERNSSAILNESMVVEIRMRAANGELHKDLAKEYGVSKSTISHAISGHNWGHIKDGQPRCHAFVEAGQSIPVKDEHTLDLFAKAP